MTFDREPDLDNANVGKPEHKFGKMYVIVGVTKSVAPFFIALEVNIVIKINGESLDVAGVSIEKYLADAGYDAKRVALEINGDILPKSQYENTCFKDGDTVEVVSFVGGG